MAELQWNDLLVQFGIGAFETMLLTKGKIPLLNWHRQRLQKALSRWEHPEDALDKTWEKLEADLQKAHSNDQNMRIKLLVGLGREKQLLQHIYAIPFQANPNPRNLLCRAQVTFQQQTYKSCQYEDHYFSLQQAKQAQHDDAVYFNAKDELLECSTSALLFQKDQKLCAIQGSTLTSSSIQSLLDRFPKDVISHRPIQLEDLPKETLWFTCNALHGIAPIQKITTIAGEEHHFRVAPEMMLKSWNQRLFAHS
jgi:branched-subunit amino acid aminotransferase/4-amino-4-deoxychorismate lyase